jgi:enamine deaminase RidA (YjgF/YER057c/UK114 family)
MTNIQNIDPSERSSPAVIYNGMVFLAGQVAAGATVAKQTEAILAKIDVLLAKAGTDKSRLLQATIWLADIKTFEDMNAVWNAWVTPGKPPARATGEVRLASDEYRVEITVIAAVANIEA